jgi:hypothetical protein
MLSFENSFILLEIRESKHGEKRPEVPYDVIRLPFSLLSPCHSLPLSRVYSCIFTMLRTLTHVHDLIFPFTWYISILSGEFHLIPEYQLVGNRLPRYISVLLR